MSRYSGTPTQLTTQRSADENTVTPRPDMDGSRSRKSPEMRGGPAVMRPRERSVEAVSPQ